VKNRKVVFVMVLFALVLLLSCENATNGESSAPPFDPSGFFAAPGLEAGDSTITASWEVVPGADVYGVYYGRVGNGVGRVQYGPDIRDTAVTIRGLVNLHTYYVWVRAKDSDGYFVESGAASLFLLERPSKAPTAQVAGREGGRVELSWEAARQATAYEVWYGTEEDPKRASKWPIDITGASASILGLVNNSTYYIWVRSKTVCGESAFSPAASALPQALLGGAAAIDGNPMVGEALTANTSGLDREGARSYRWYRSNTPDGAKTLIIGAEALTHTPDNNDWNKYLSVELTVEGYRGSVMSSETTAVGFPRISWTPANVMSQPAGGLRPGRFLYRRIGGEWKWIGPGGSGILLSGDGMNWEQITTPYSPGDSIIDTGEDTDMRFISSNGRVHSPDGRTWSLLNPNREVRCVAYGKINGADRYVAAYGERGLLFSTDCKIWELVSPDYSAGGTGVFGPGSVTIFDIVFSPRIDGIVYDAPNQRFVAQVDLGPYLPRKCAYSEDGFAWDGPYDGGIPAVPPDEGDASRFSYYEAYPNGNYFGEVQFKDEDNRTISLPQGMVGSFGYLSIDNRPAVLVTVTGISLESQWRFYSLDQPQQ
jgi:hypothetical protein